MQLGWTPVPPPPDPATDLTLVCNQTTFLISDNSRKGRGYKYDTIVTDNDRASWACSSYLKDLLIQDSGTKDSDALGVDDSPIASPQRPGHLLLTVHDDGDALLIHAESDTMPPAQQRHNVKRDARVILSPSSLNWERPWLSWLILVVFVVNCVSAKVKDTVIEADTDIFSPLSHSYLFISIYI